MKVLADENCDRAFVAFLRGLGHDVSWVAEKSPGSTDPDVLQRANREFPVLLTCDKDFGDLIYRQSTAAIGVVLVRLTAAKNDDRDAAFRAAWPAVEPRAIGSFVVVTEQKTRVRPLPRRR